MALNKPLAIDLYAGLGGWAEGFLAEGYNVIGFDIQRHRYPVSRQSEDGRKNGHIGGSWFAIGSPGQKTLRGNPDGRNGRELTGEWCEYPGQLVLQDVLTLHGSQFRNAAVIVASPPCQAYSYRAMPWKRAKALPPPSNELFGACFRIQREASEAAGRYIPLVVENVCGAQKWVGRAKWHFGSFYLWGDVPALMPMRFTGQKFNPDGTDHGVGSWFAIADSKNRGASVGQKAPAYSDPRRNGGRGVHLTSPHENQEGVKGYANRFEDTPWSRFGSKSSARKQASAEIARIPWDLANWIARVYKP